MWTIQNLKQRGNAVFHKSYWRSVLAALVLSIAGGTAGGMTRTVTYHYTTEYPGSIHFYGNFGNAMEQFGNNVQGVISGFGPLLPIISLFAAITIWSFLAMRIAIDIFLLAPLEAGSQRFFVVNHYTDGNAKVPEILYPFSHSYMNVVKTMLLRAVYTFLWSCLLIVPGIIKGYSYRLVPYIIAENPEMQTKEAFRLSMEMMNGHKWHTFLLDLSFIGWEILNLFTFGILDLFYVTPYRFSTNTELYVTLKENYLGAQD